MKIAVSALCALLALAGLADTRQAHAMDLQLTGKTALVTGSTGGIGYGIAKTLLREGAQVIINGRTRDSVDKAAASLEAATGKTPLTFAGDMSKPDDIAKLVKAFPNVDILVNNVARFAARPFTELTDQDWYDSFDLNSILPGPTFDADDPRAARRFGGRSMAEVEDQLFKTARPTSIIKRFARTEEVASLVAYIASPLSSATTGAALRVDGGVVKSAF